MPTGNGSDSTRSASPAADATTSPRGTGCRSRYAFTRRNTITASTRPTPIDLLKRLEATYGIYRRFQYSGVPAPTDSDWHWWGKLDEKGCGAVVVIRGSGGHDRRAINIPWVDPAGTYKIAARLQAKDLGVFTGTQLQDGKLLLALPLLGQEILELSRVEAN